MFKYSKETGGFYVDAIHGNNIPPDAVAISEEQHTALIEGQVLGKIIVGDENGYPVLQDVVLTEAQVVTAYMAAVQKYMDGVAVTYGYDNLVSVVSYADESIVTRYQKEGQGFREWRSLVWAYCEQVFADVKAEVRTAPTHEELIAELPELIIPE
jgi:hypothetical protein